MGDFVCLSMLGGLHISPLVFVLGSQNFVNRLMLTKTGFKTSCDEACGTHHISLPRPHKHSKPVLC